MVLRTTAKTSRMAIHLACSALLIFITKSRPYYSYGTMGNRKNAIQARYAYLSDLFKAIAFLIQELDSPHELEYSEVAYFDKLLSRGRRLPAKVSSMPKAPSLNAYSIFLRDFRHLASSSENEFFKEMMERWENIDEKTKKQCKDRASEENKQRRKLFAGKRKKGKESAGEV